MPEKVYESDGCCVTVCRKQERYYAGLTEEEVVRRVIEDFWFNSVSAMGSQGKEALGDRVSIGPYKTRPKEKDHQYHPGNPGSPGL
ncbi:MAG: hypothetical protein KKE20_07485 [Nanoarchaeota archaeon]|nr:hypothetical protein [Nanoarchaeota archaeon]